jgi:hypothetical protein
MNLEEKIERLTGIVDARAGAVVAHDNQIEAHSRQIGAMIELAATHGAHIEALIKMSQESALNWKNLERQWQAYINTLPRQ